MRTKKQTLNLKILLITASIIFANSCKTEDPANLPVVTTELTVTNILPTTATAGGSVTDDKGETVTARGVCWSLNINPTIKDSITKDGSGAGKFISNIKNLLSNSNYYLRAYATNKSGTAYGNTISFTTLTGIIIQSTNLMTEITGTTATTGGYISSDGGGYITERGVCFSKTPNPTIANSKVSSGYGKGSFATILTNLSENTVYYVRTYAKNETGTSYGNEITFNSGRIIGSTYAGGFVFNNDGNGHGLVCATTDQSASALWGCRYTTIGTTFTTGNTNTTNIVEKCATKGTAAEICYSLELNSYTDWFLPSKSELYLMYKNLYLNGKGNFASGLYWSSTEGSSSGDAWSISFRSIDIGHQYDYEGSKENLKYVRAIRFF